MEGLFCLSCDGRLWGWFATLLLHVAIAPIAVFAVQPDSAQESLKNIISDLESADAKTRRHGVDAAYKLMPEFTGPWGDWSSPKGIRAFPSSGREHVPSLVQLLDHSDDHVVLAAADLLGTVGVGDEMALLQLRRVAQDLKRSYAVRETTAFMILYVTPDTRSVVGELIGSPDAPLRPELMATDFVSPLSEGAQSMRFGAIGRVVTIVGSQLRASGHTIVEVPALVDLATSKERDVDTRIMATLTLGELGQEAASSQAALLKLLKDEDPLVSWGAAISIVRIDENVNAETLAKLADRAGIKDDRLALFIEKMNHIIESQVEQREALRRTGADLLPMLIAMIEHGRAAHCREAIRTIGELGKAGEPARASLLHVVATTKDEASRNLARNVLRVLDSRLESDP